MKSIEGFQVHAFGLVMTASGFWEIHGSFLGSVHSHSKRRHGSPASLRVYKLLYLYTHCKLFAMCWVGLLLTVVSIHPMQSFFQNPNQPLLRCTFEPHFPIVKKSLSPTSPRPGVIIPRSFTCLSRSPTQISTDSVPFSSAARLTPSLLPSTLISITCFTPHSSNVCMAALEVPPVAITGSRSMAMSGIGNGSGLTDVGR